MNDSTNYQPQADEKSANTRDYLPDAAKAVADEFLEVLWRRKGVVGAITVACLAAGMLYLLSAVPKYSSTARIYVEPEAPRIVQDVEQVGTMLGRASNFLNTQAALLKSSAILIGVLEQPGIKDLPSLANASDRIGMLRRNLTVEVGTKDDIINISYLSPNPDDSSKIVQAVVAAYIADNTKRQKSTASEMLTILKNEKDKCDAAIKEKNKALLDFKKENGVLSFENDEQNYVTKRLGLLSNALTEAQLESIKTKASYELATSAMNLRVADKQDPSQIPPLLGSESRGFNERLFTAQQRYNRLTQNFTSDHPVVQEAKTSLELLRQEYLDNARQNYEAAQKQEKSIRTLMSEQQKLAEALNVKAAEYAMLQAELERTRKLSDILDTRIKEIDLTEDTGGMNINLLESAKPSKSPATPKTSRVLAIALLLGMIVGTAAALGYDRLDGRIRSFSELSAVTGLPVIGSVPVLSSSNTAAERGQEVHLNPLSYAAEAFRAVRTSIYSSMFGKGKTLLITSPVSGEGKSTVISNIGISMAQNGQRVLIVDADFRRPAMHEIFPTQGSAGLAGVVTGFVSLDEAIRETTLAKLDVLPCGDIKKNPAELLSSHQFAQVLGKLTEIYDWVLIDAPAVLPVADARILARIVDRSLIVLHSERTTRDQALQASGCLHSVGGDLMGFIVNSASKNIANTIHRQYYVRGDLPGAYQRPSFFRRSDRSKDFFVVLPQDQNPWQQPQGQPQPPPQPGPQPWVPPQPAPEVEPQQAEPTEQPPNVPPGGPQVQSKPPETGEGEAPPQ